MAGELLLVLLLKRAGNHAQHSEGTLLATINPTGDREDETIPRARGEGARFFTVASTVCEIFAVKPRDSV
jgi:hypothetical protein